MGLPCCARILDSWLVSHIIKLLQIPMTPCFNGVIIYYISDDNILYKCDNILYNIVYDISIIIYYISVIIYYISDDNILYKCNNILYNIVYDISMIIYYISVIIYYK